MLVGIIVMLSVVMVANGDKVHCPPGSSLYSGDNTCIKHHDTSETYDTAKTNCIGEGGRLVELSRLEKDEFVTTLHPTGKSWHSVVRGSDGWMINDDTSLGDHKPFSIDYSAGINCVTRQFAAATIEWMATTCTEEHTYTCESNAVVCQDRWTPNFVTGKCTKVIKKHRRTFEGARKFCQNKGADLAINVFSDHDINTAMANTKKKGMYWIGVHDPSNGGTFETIFSAFDFDTTIRWKRMISQNPANEHFCVMLKRRRWLSKKCTKKLNFICETL